MTRFTCKTPLGTIEIPCTPFQKTVWTALLRIPKGDTVTYSELARRIGRPRAVRAVASAVASNPLMILVPCHRVVPKSGGWGRYAWGARRKSLILRHEGARLA